MCNFYNVQDQYKNMTLEKVVEIQKQNSKNFYACFLNIEGDLNISIMIRTSCLLGAKGVYILGRRKYDRRGTVGAEHYISIEKVNCLTENCLLDSQKIIEFLSQDKFYPIFVEHGGLDIGKCRQEAKYLLKNTIQNLDFRQKLPIIVVGNEASGIPLEVLNYFKGNSLHFSLPQYGVMRSFNVSNAYAIFLWFFLDCLEWL